MTLASLFLSAALLSPQQPAPDAFRAHPYGVASFFVSNHPATGEPYHRVDDRLGGQTWTIAGAGGVWVSAAVGLEGEVAFSGRVSAPQEFHYTTSYQYTVSNRDTLLNALVRWRPGGHGIVHILGGGGYAHATRQETSVTMIDSFGRRTALPDYPPKAYHRFTLTGGMDVAIPAGARVSVAPGFRVRWMRRPRSFEPGWTGLGDFTIQFGATLMIR